MKDSMFKATFVQAKQPNCGHKNRSPKHFRDQLKVNQTACGCRALQVSTHTDFPFYSLFPQPHRSLIEEDTPIPGQTHCCHFPRGMCSDNRMLLQPLKNQTRPPLPHDSIAFIVPCSLQEEAECAEVAQGGGKVICSEEKYSYSNLQHHILVEKKCPYMKNTVSRKELQNVECY